MEAGSTSTTIETADRPTAGVRVRTALSAVVAAALGALPHVLHHAGPLAGAALFAGVTGSLLFGLLGLEAALPFLLRMRRRSGGWRRPLAALALLAAAFSISTFVIAPALTDGEEEPRSRPAGQPAGHDEHHP